MSKKTVFENIVLRPIADTYTDRIFIKSLFDYADIKTHYTLRPDHSADINSFVSYLADSNLRNAPIHSIIETNDGDSAGFITAEPHSGAGGLPAWNIGFAILPLYRGNGYAKEAVNAIASILSSFPIKTMELDISTDNKAAEAVAKACGCVQFKSPTGGILGFKDPQHPELGIRTCWVRSVKTSGKRDEYGNEAIEAHKDKDYRSAITYYKEALNEPYPTGSLFTDAQIYSNMAMAYSSLRRFAKAYLLLKKAWEMGCQNESVKRELQWMRDNASSEISRLDATDLINLSEFRLGHSFRLKSEFRKEMMQDFQKIVKDNREDITIIMMQAETLFVSLGHLIEYIDEGGVSVDELKKIAEALFRDAKGVTMDLFPLYGERPNNDTKEWYDKGVNSLLDEVYGLIPEGSSSIRSFVTEFHKRLNSDQLIRPIDLIRNYFY